MTQRGVNNYAKEWSAGAAGPVLAAEERAEPHWTDLALCAEVGGDLWFPEYGENAAEAKRICRMCEVREACLQFAMDTGQLWGVWGGTSERERLVLRRQARNARMAVAA